MTANNTIYVVLDCNKNTFYEVQHNHTSVLNMLYTLDENMLSLRMDLEHIAQSSTGAKVTSKSVSDYYPLQPMENPEVIYKRYVANVLHFVPIIN